MDYSKLEERELIKKSQDKDTKAFEEIISRDSEYILAWIGQKAKDPYLTEELYQMTMIKCWKNIAKFKGDSAFRTWACAIGRNLFIDNYRRKIRRSEESLELSEIGRSRLAGLTVEEDFLKNFKNEELKTFLNKIMSSLSVNHRNALRYFAIEGMSYEEISKIEKCSIGTVMSRLYYARRKAQYLINRQKNTGSFVDG